MHENFTAAGSKKIESGSGVTLGRDDPVGLKLVEGSIEGEVVGGTDGDSLGTGDVGFIDIEGSKEGEDDGGADGDSDGPFVGSAEGRADGDADGIFEGSSDGDDDGIFDGGDDGISDGPIEMVGAIEGMMLMDGSSEG
mmetsp:Transcript_37846/g.80846  ORF Transcript_37846/g.80846 Transcript_37846/m.80846 type:complete len:138 (-) Transcript_37846:163-576(-)